MSDDTRTPITTPPAEVLPAAAAWRNGPHGTADECLEQLSIGVALLDRVSGRADLAGSYELANLTLITSAMVASLCDLTAADLRALAHLCQRFADVLDGPADAEEGIG